MQYGDDERIIRDSIQRENSYNNLLAIRKKVRNYYSKLPFSVYIDLRGRIEERINKFNSPMCDNVSISVIGRDESAMLLSADECDYAVANNIKLSDHIFGKYNDAVDFKLSNFLGSYDKNKSDTPGKKEPQHFRGEGLRNELSADFLENTVVYLIRLLDHLEQMYGSSRLDIEGDIRSMKGILDNVFEKVMGNEPYLRARKD